MKGELSVCGEATNRNTQGAAQGLSFLMFLQVTLICKASVLLVFAHSIKETGPHFSGRGLRSLELEEKVTGDTKTG